MFSLKIAWHNLTHIIFLNAGQPTDMYLIFEVGVYLKIKLTQETSTKASLIRVFFPGLNLKEDHARKFQPAMKPAVFKKVYTIEWLPMTLMSTNFHFLLSHLNYLLVVLVIKVALKAIRYTAGFKNLFL